MLLNFGVFMTLIFGKVCQAIFFGPLRPIEVEHLYERSWYAVTETLLAMTIFRDEFDSSFVVLFGTLLFLKVFHWLCSDRVELVSMRNREGLLWRDAALGSFRSLTSLRVASTSSLAVDGAIALCDEAIPRSHDLGALVIILR